MAGNTLVLLATDKAEGWLGEHSNVPSWTLLEAFTEILGEPDRLKVKLVYVHIPPHEDRILKWTLFICFGPVFPKGFEVQADSYPEKFVKDHTFPGNWLFREKSPAINN